MSLINQMLRDLERRQVPLMVGASQVLADIGSSAGPDALSEASSEASSEAGSEEGRRSRPALRRAGLLLTAALAAAVLLGPSRLGGDRTAAPTAPAAAPGTRSPRLLSSPGMEAPAPPGTATDISAGTSREPPGAPGAYSSPDPGPSAGPAPAPRNAIGAAPDDGWSGARVLAEGTQIANASPLPRHDRSALARAFSSPAASHVAADPSLVAPASGWMRDEASPAPAAAVDAPLPGPRGESMQIRAAIPPPHDLAAAQRLERSGDASGAMAAYRSVLEADPSNVDARLRLVALQLAVGETTAAEGRLAQGLALRADEPRLAQPYARLLVERDATGTAIEVLTRALPRAGTDPEYTAFLAAVLQSAERHREAAALYRGALGQLPGAAHWWMGLGISLEALGERGGALQAFRRAGRGAGLAPEVERYIRTKISALGGAG